MIFRLAALLLTALALTAAESTFIFETAPFAECHASTIVEHPDHTLSAAWFGGTREGAPDVAIWLSDWRAGGWSAPREVVREPHVATYNPVLFYTKDGKLWLFYRFGPSPERWTSGYLTSADHGQTWSKPVHLPSGLHGPIKNKPLVLKDGTVLAGSSSESYSSWASYVDRSTDNGKSWTRHGPILLDHQMEQGTEGKRYGTIQPALVTLTNGHVRAYLRTTEPVGKIAYADSLDGGLSWGTARLLDLPNPNSGIDAVSLTDGRVAMVYNHTAQGRSPLNVAISTDGRQWTPLATLESEPGEYSYPAIIQARDGRLHITYTWNRKKIRHVVLPLPVR